MNNKFYSPSGNFEVWKEKPSGYFTAEEWAEHKKSLETLEEVQAQKIQALEAEISTENNTGVEYKGETYKFDSEAILDLMLNLQQASTYSTQFFDVEKANGEASLVSQEEVHELYDAMILKRHLLKDFKRKKKKEIMQCQELDKLREIDVCYTHDTADEMS